MGSEARGKTKRIKPLATQSFFMFAYMPEAASGFTILLLT